jgi:acyl-CoA thioesterase-1
MIGRVIGCVFAMLRAKGYDVRVANAGVTSDTPSGMLARLDSAVAQGTRVVKN